MIKNKTQKNIPNDWQEKKLGEICEINPRVLGLPEEFIYIDLESVVNGALTKKNRILKTEAPSRAQRVLRNNDILFQMVRPYQKNNLFFNFGDVYVASTGYAQIRARHSSMYLYQYLNTQRFVNKVLVRCTGSSYPAINSTDLAKIQVILPPLPEQKQIVKVLEVWDEAIEKLERKIKIKKNIKKGLMQRLLTGKVRLPGFMEPWRTIKLGDVCDIGTGEKNNQDKIKDGKYPFFVRSQNVERINTFSFDGEAILLPGEGNIGKIFHYINGKFDYHQRVYKVSGFNNKIFGRYVYYYFFQNFLKQAMSDSVKATVDSLRLPTFNKFKILLLSFNEQRAIAKILTTADKEIEILEKKKKIINEQKKYLLNNLVTGKIRVLKSV